MCNHVLNRYQKFSKRTSRVFENDLNEFLKGFLKELQECLFLVCLDLGGGVVTIVLQSGLLVFSFLHFLSGVFLP